MIKNRKQMFIVIGVFCLTLLLGTVTYAFFNYTRTGAANTIRTGKIAFNSQQGTAINLTNVFPIDVTNGIPNNNANVGSVTINVTGDTTYTEGVEYLVSAVNVQNTIGSGANAKSLPISIDVSFSANGSGKVIGIADNDYFTNRGGNSSIYKILATDTINSNDQLVVGYIKPDSTGIDGNIVIRAYLDASKIVISDTYNPDASVYYTLNKNMNSTEFDACVNYFNENKNRRPFLNYYGDFDSTTRDPGAYFCNGLANDYYLSFDNILEYEIDDGWNGFTSQDIEFFLNNNIINPPQVDNYGTTGEWVDDRIVFTTTEWNSLQTNGVSFQVKVEANDGIWMEDPTPTIPTIDSCPGCVYAFPNGLYLGSSTLQSTDYSDDYHDVVNTTGVNYFVGLIKNAVTDKIDKAFACGIKSDNQNNNIPFCIEGTLDGSKHSDNISLLQSPSLWNNSCNTGGTTTCGDQESISARSYDDGGVWVGDDIENYWCIIYGDDDGEIACSKE